MQASESLDSVDLSSREVFRNLPPLAEAPPFPITKPPKPTDLLGRI